MTKDEARERLRRLIDEGLIKTTGHAQRREKALDAYALACVDAALSDTLGLLEEVADSEWAVTLETGGEEHFKIRVQQNPDRTVGAFRYWIAEPGERLGEETTRAEVAVLLAREEKKGE